jgi:hypothetical protein
MENRNSEKFQGIDRRKFLVSAGVVGASVASPAVAGAVPGAVHSDPEATIRRQAFEAVTARNEVRKEAQLPLVNVEAEVRHMIAVHQERQFQEFLEANRAKAERALGIDRSQICSMGQSMATGVKVRRLVWQWWCLGEGV